MLEIVYKGGKSIEIRLGNASYLYDSGVSQFIEHHGYAVLYGCDTTIDGNETPCNAIFIFMTPETVIDEILTYIAQFKTKYVIPMYDELTLEMNHVLQDLARRIMLDNYGVPKVLKPGQMIVL